MNYPPGYLVEQLEGSLATIEAAAGKLEIPNDPKALLAAFTGYYGLDNAGGFFSIDNVAMYANSSLTGRSVKISVSLDGKSSTAWDFDESHASFDGQMLVIPRKLKVGLNRGYQEGRLAQVSGTILEKTVTGYTYFNPVELPVFAGNYYKEIKPTPPVTLIVAESSVKFDFGDGRGLQNIPAFIYVPSMYVILFQSDGVTYTLMLGTASEHGLACFVTDSRKGSESGYYIVTIP